MGRNEPPPPLGHFFVRIVGPDAIEATANAAWDLGFRSVTWEPVRDPDDEQPGTWMVWGRRPPLDACPLCHDGIEEGGAGEEDDEGEEEDEETVTDSSP